MGVANDVGLSARGTGGESASAVLEGFGEGASGRGGVAAVQQDGSDLGMMRRADLQMGALAESSVVGVVVGRREVEIGAVDEEFSLTRQNNGATPDSAAWGISISISLDVR